MKLFYSRKDKAAMQVATGRCLLLGLMQRTAVGGLQGGIGCGGSDTHDVGCDVGSESREAVGSASSESGIRGRMLPLPRYCSLLPSLRVSHVSEMVDDDKYAEQQKITREY
ncbi:hypothetical protein BHM03_00024356 [Ensete ventricosum]|nr:hypothetical protein BHM03_00024356 [Ensete ventricosum]